MSIHTDDVALRDSWLTAERVAPSSRRQVLGVLAGAIAGVLLLNYAAAVALANDSRNLGYWLVRQKWERLNDLREPVDWLVLGDSSGNQSVMPSVLAERLGGRAVNLCTVANMLAVNDAWMLDAYIQRMGSPKNVVLVHVYDSWRRDLETALVTKIPRPWGFWRDLSPPVQLSNRQLAEAALDRYAPLYSRHATLASLLRRSDPSPIGAFTLGDDGFMNVVSAKPEAVEREREEHAKVAREQPFVMSAMNRAALTRIRGLAETHGFDVYLANAPIYGRLWEEPGFAAYYAGVMRELKALIGSSERMHLLLEQPMQFPVSELQGVDHVTGAGALRYSAHLADALRAAQEDGKAGR